MSHVTELERQLVFDIAQGNFSVIHFIGMYRNLCAEARDMNYIQGLMWLKKEKLVGADFISWLKDKHRGSILYAAADIRKRASRDFKTRKIYARRGL